MLLLFPIFMRDLFVVEYSPLFLVMYQKANVISMSSVHTGQAITSPSPSEVAYLIFWRRLFGNLSMVSHRT